MDIHQQCCSLFLLCFMSSTRTKGSERRCIIILISGESNKVYLYYIYINFYMFYSYIILHNVLFKSPQKDKQSNNKSVIQSENKENINGLRCLRATEVHLTCVRTSIPNVSVQQTKEVVYQEVTYHRQSSSSQS